MDPRPICRNCGRRWLPPEGVDATIHFCSRCSKERRESSRKAEVASGRQRVRVGPYLLRVAKNA
jgi:hypothetical protein